MHIIKCGDAKKLLSEIKDSSIDLICTDPPYKDYQSSRTKEKAKKISSKNFHWESLIKEIERILKPGRHFYIWCDSLTYSDLYITIKNSKILKFKNMIIWIKSNHGSGDLKSGYAPQHEICVYGHHGKGRAFESNKKRISDVLFKKEDNGRIKFYKKVSPREGHPTIKPHEILKSLIERSSKKNEIVLDPYAGSFSTMKASRELNRRSLSFELDKQYYKKGREFLKKNT